MKLTLISILFCLQTAFGQTPTKIDTLTFCHYRYKVPSGCSAESEYQVKCDNYSIVWLYMNDQMMQYLPDQFVNQMAGQFKGFKKESIDCYLLGKKTKGYKISFKTGEEQAMSILLMVQ